MNRVTEVNQALEKAGRAERLRRGHNFYYFAGGAADDWFQQSVSVKRATDLSVEQWLKEFWSLVELNNLPHGTAKPTRSKPKAD